MAKVQFSLFHTQFGETICTVEMDEDLLDPKAGIIDVDSMTLRPLKGGGSYTLIPADDYKVTALRRVHTVYNRITTEGCKLNSQWAHRMDEVLMAVNLLFDPVEFMLVENAEDMQNLIERPKDADWEPKTVTHSVLDELLGQALGDLDKEKSSDAALIEAMVTSDDLPPNA